MSVTRRRCGGKPGFSTRSWRTTAVPGSPSLWTSTADELAGVSSCPPLSSCAIVLLRALCHVKYRLVRLRCDPDGRTDDRADTEDPEEQALCHGAERTEFEAAGGLVLLDVLEVGDD